MIVAVAYIAVGVINALIWCRAKPERAAILAFIAQSQAADRAISDMERIA